MNAEQAKALRDELLHIGCFTNGDARCTCAIGADAADLIGTLAARIEALEAEKDELRILLARVLVMDFGSAEDGADALGGIGDVIGMVEEYHAARAALAQEVPE